ncbi:hypothetical protein PFISCL1PPCAC_20755, partial [Pristionchus fissidentatus]
RSPLFPSPMSPFLPRDNEDSQKDDIRKPPLINPETASETIAESTSGESEVTAPLYECEASTSNFVDERCLQAPEYVSTLRQVLAIVETMKKILDQLKTLRLNYLYRMKNCRRRSTGTECSCVNQKEAEEVKEVRRTLTSTSPHFHRLYSEWRALKKEEDAAGRVVYEPQMIRDVEYADEQYFVVFSTFWNIEKVDKQIPQLEEIHSQEETPDIIFLN